MADLIWRDPDAPRDEYDPADWEMEDANADAPVIVCAGCGATVFATLPGDLYCVPCDAEITVEQARSEMARAHASHDYADVFDRAESDPWYDALIDDGPPF
jgi:hypothetical protein